jgi:hypothetical protein
MSSGPKQPKPVDPNVAAEAQARWNRTGQVTPFGSVTWEGNNQVVNPSDAMMALFNQAQGIASGGAQQYQKPEGFDSIRDSVMGRLNANTYQPGSRSEAKPGIDQTSLAKGSPIRDAFFGEKDPNTGDRRVLRHIARGGLMGSIPRAIGNLIDEHRANQMPGAASLGAPGNSPIGGNGFDLGPLLTSMGTKPSSTRGMPGPVALDPIAPSPIERLDAKPSMKPTLAPTRGLGRKPTARERQAMRKDPNSILNAGANGLKPLFTSPTAALFNQYDLQTSPGGAFDAAVAAYMAAQKPNRNIQQ